jgi:hypothetical protein
LHQRLYICGMKWFCSLLILLYSIQAQAVRYELFEVRGKFGLKDESGKIVLPAKFESLGWSDGSFTLVNEVTGYKANNLWGLVNLKKEFITQALYESLTHAGGNIIVAQKKNNALEYKTGCLGLKGETLIPFVYDGIKINALQAIVFKKLGNVYNYGVVNFKNEFVIPLMYAHITSRGASRYLVENNKGQHAIYSDRGLPLTTFKIDSISTYHKNYAVFYQGFNQGLIDREGNIVVEADYRKIESKEDGTFSGQLPSQCLILTGDNKIVTQMQADGLTNSLGHYYKFKRGSLFGLCNRELKIVLDPQYEFLKETANKLFIARKGAYGIIGMDNSMRLPFEFDSIIVIHNAVIVKERTLEKNKWALYDTLGKKRTSSNYQWIGEEKDTYLPVKKRGYWGVIQNKGQEVIPCVYDSILNHRSDKFAVKLKNEFGVINSNEDWLVAPQQFPLLVIHDNRILMTKDNRHYIMDFGGNIIYFSENTFEFANTFFVEKQKNGTERKMDYSGRLLTSAPVTKVVNVETFYTESEGFRGIKKDGKFGFIDKRGNLRVANRYDAIQPFNEGLAAVKLNNKWGYINIDEHIVIQPSYEYVSDFKNNKALVKRKNKFGLINKEGKVLLAIQYDSIQALPEQNYLLKSNRLIGLADKEGKVIIEPKFDMLTSLGNGYLIAGRDKKFGLVTYEGISTVPLLYDQLTYNKATNTYLVMKLGDWQAVKLVNRP